MYKVINKYEFIKAFEDMGRQGQFSKQGLSRLFEYIEEYEEETERAIELDVIELCTTFTEYESLKEFNKEYPDINSLEKLEDHTTIIKIDNDKFIIQDF